MDAIEILTAPEPDASVIWLHGLGADGHDFEGIVPELQLARGSAIRFVFPHAPVMPVTVNGGMPMRAWYDILGTELVRREDEAGLRRSLGLVTGLIAREVERGIPGSRIVLAGFSQGAAMTLLVGLRNPESLAGLMVLSGYLPLASQTTAERTEASSSVPIFMAHGLADPVIPVARALESRAVLEALGYAIEWHDYAMPHSLCAQEITDIAGWLGRVLPPRVA